MNSVENPTYVEKELLQFIFIVKYEKKWQGNNLVL